MSFNVTQCPACESTFSTNSRVLAAASGKVRCGACLNVFEAIDHFLLHDDDEAGAESADSVFVGNNPQEFFDPTRFLTRSALREPDQDLGDEIDPIAEQFLHEELEQEQTVDEEFFTTVTEELQDKNASEHVPDGLSDLAAHEEQSIEEQQIAAEVDASFEEDMLASFQDSDTTIEQEVADDVAEPSDVTHEDDDLALDVEQDTDEATEHETPAHEPVLGFQAPRAQFDTADTVSVSQVDSDTAELAESDSEPSPDLNPQIDPDRNPDLAPAPDPISGEQPSQSEVSTPEESTVGLAISASFSFGYTPHQPAHEDPEPAGEEDVEALPDADELIATAPESEPESASESVVHSESGETDTVEDSSQFMDAIVDEIEPSPWVLDEGQAQLGDPAQRQIEAPDSNAEENMEEEAPAVDSSHEVAEFSDIVESSFSEAEDGTLENLAEAVSEPADTTLIDAEELEAYFEEIPEGEASAAQSTESIDVSEHNTDVVDAEQDSENSDAVAAQETTDENSAAVMETTAPTDEEAEADTREDEEDSTEAIRARALEAELADEEALEAIPSENLKALGTMSTPVELLAGKESRLLRSALLALSIVFLGGVLSAQYLWQRMELYSQLPQLRGAYEFACGRLGCELPEFRSIGEIRSENLNVQSHPSFANGLMVNTVIRNTAAFDQPFPILILSFNSAENSVVALREFSAEEYLDPGLRSIESMPPMTPVQIDLEIMDPGPLAVNYTLAFRFP